MKNYKENSSGRKKKDYGTMKFQDMAKRINFFLKKEGLSLNFKGYTDTVLRYFRLEDHDMYEVYQVMTECNLWSNYFTDIENFIQAKALEYTLEKDRLNAYFNKKAPDEKLELEIKKITRKAKDFTVFHKQVITQRIFFEKSYWHCYRLYGKAVNTMNYKTLD